MHSKISQIRLFLFLWVVLLNVGLFKNSLYSENSSNRDIALKQVYQDNQWIDESKLIFLYNPSNQLDAIEHYEWHNNTWENDIIITYTYNVNNQLEERKETLIPSNKLLASELYEYDQEGRLIQISFPDVPWYRGRGLFGTQSVGILTMIDPYLLVNHMNNIQYIYNDSGLMTQVEYNFKADQIQSTIVFFTTNSANRPHPMDPKIASPDDYADSIKTLQPNSIYNEVKITGHYSYMTNGNQLSVIYTNPSHLTYTERHRLWDFYELWYPNEMRTIWIYSQNTDSNLVSTPQIGHVNPQQEISPFKDMLTFWIVKSFEEDRPILPIQFLGDYVTIVKGYFSSKIEKSLTLSNTYIPGNYYDYFFEPRFKGSYPIQNRKIIKTVEQYRLPHTKLNSPAYYGIGWEFQNEWINYLERNYEFDDSGQLQQNTIKRWEWDRINNTNPFSGQWENDSQYEFQYDESGNCDQIICSVWNSKSNAWDNSFRILYTYTDIPNETSQPNVTQIELKNYPDPFNTSTHIRFLLTEPAQVSLKVYDIRGKLIQTILAEQLLTGQHHIFEWNGQNNEGKTASSGMYLFQLQVGDRQIVEKCLFVK